MRWCDTGETDASAARDELDGRPISVAKLDTLCAGDTARTDCEDDAGTKAGDPPSRSCWFSDSSSATRFSSHREGCFR